MGWKGKVGTLAPGAFADLIAIRRRTPGRTSARVEHLAGRPEGRRGSSRRSPLTLERVRDALKCRAHARRARPARRLRPAPRPALPAVPAPPRLPAPRRRPRRPTRSRALFAAEWEYAMREWPDLASRLGDHRFDDRWPDVSPAGYERRAAHDRELLRPGVRAIDRARLPPARTASASTLFFRRERSRTPWRAALPPLAPRARSARRHPDRRRARRPRCPSRPTRDYEALARAAARAPRVRRADARDCCARACRSTSCSRGWSMERVPAQIAKQIVARPGEEPVLRALPPHPRLDPARPSASGSSARRARRSPMSSSPPTAGSTSSSSREYLPACLPARRRLAAAARRRGLRVPRAPCTRRRGMTPAGDPRPRPPRGGAHPRRDARR